MEDRIQRFVSEFSQWASEQTQILAVAVVGSRARGTATDRSDLDLVILARRPEVFLGNHDWVYDFGTVRRLGVEDYGRVTSVRVRYEDQLGVC